MKKLLIALTLALTSFVGVNQLQAQTTYPDYNILAQETFTFSDVNLFADHHRLTSNNISFPQGTELLDIRFSESEYHTHVNDGNVESMIEFYDSLGDKITEIRLNQIRTGTIGGERYLVPLERYGVQDAEEIRINVAQTYSTVPGGYVDYINDKGPSIRFSDEIVIIEYTPNVDLEFENFNFYGDYNGLRSELIELPIGVVTAIVELPETQYNLATAGGIESKIVFYDFQNNVLSSVPLTGTIGGTYQPDVPPDAVYMRVQVMQSYEFVPSGYTGYFNRNSSLTYNDYKVATFYIRGQVFETQEFVKFVDPPSDIPDDLTPYGFAPATDYKFNGWVYYDENGELNTFDFYSPQTDDIELYASITRSGSLGGNLGTIDDPTATPGGADESLHTLLGAFNMDNPEGNVIFTVLVLLIANFVLIITGIKGFALPIVNVAVLGLLFFGGFVPFWVMLILGMILGLMFVGMRGGMQQYE